MISIAGAGAVYLAGAGSLLLIGRGLSWLRHPEGDLRARMRLPSGALLAGAILSMLLLEAALILDDFSVKYVAEHHSRDTPLLFTIASAWAALEGSIVLWGLVLAGYVAMVWRKLAPDDRLGAAAMVVLGIISLFFFAMIATVANPFTAIDPVPMDGPGPNPLLQNNILMAVHPPLLYLGYVGFSVPFAFAVAALALGESGTAWLKRSHRSSLVAWSFLTAGIVAGAWWSYAVLGWGGYWAWDPVENASLLPWLVGTAFIHSALVQLRRGMLQAWNMILVIATFSLTILGTFLTRSGVVASVHSFTQSAIGPTLLGFLLLVVVGSLALFARRAHMVASSPRLESLVSRDGSFLANNLLLTVFAFVVLTGTLYPLVVEAVTGDQVSVGRPFFDRMAVPLAFALLLIMGLGPALSWRVASPGVLWQRIRSPLWLALATGAVLAVVGPRVPSVVLAVMIGVFVTGVIGRILWLKTASVRKKTGVGPLRALTRVTTGNAGFWGGQLAHVGVAVVAVTIALSSGLASSAQLQLSRGSQVPFAGFTLSYVGPVERSEPNREVVGARVAVRSGGELVTVLEPRFHLYPNQSEPIVTPSILVGVGSDLYLTLMGLTEEDAQVQAFHHPGISYLWAGGFLVALGGAWALYGARTRKRPRVGPSRQRVSV